MSEKILPVTYPPLTTYPGYANALSIFCSHEEAYDWMYSHYLQIYVTQIIINSEDKENAYPTAGFAPSFFGDYDNRRLTNTICDGLFLDREKCPFLNIFEIPNELIMSYDSSYVSFFKRCIDQSMYIYAHTDVAKIKEYKLEEEYDHPIFIYGYNDDEKVFYFADFLDNYFKYTFTKCSYDEIENAFQNVKNTFLPMVKSVAAAQFVENGSFQFEMSYIQDTISEYINPDKKQAEKFAKYASSYFSPIKWKAKVHIGSDVYEFLSDFMNISLDLNIGYIDRRLYTSMCDHKEMMLKRIEYFLQKGYLGLDKAPLLNEYTKIRDAFINIRNLILKYNIKKDSAELNLVHKLLHETKSNELNLLSKIFDI